MAVDITKIRRSNYDVTWHAIDLGGLNKIDLSKLTLLFEPVKVGSLGNMKLDDRFIGLEDKAMITIEVREVTRARIEKMVPWFAGSTGQVIPIVPPVNTLIGNAYAQPLIMHPRDITGTAEDVKLYKTVPIQAFNLTRDGTKDDVWELMFMIFPDISLLPANPYGEVVAA